MESSIVTIMIIIVILLIVIIVGISIVYIVHPPKSVPNPPYYTILNKSNSYEGKRVLINFSSNGYKECQWINSQTGIQYGFDEIYSHNMSNLDKDFVIKNKNILSYKKGAGYWLWKPYIILKALEKCTSNNDIVFYADSGTYFKRNISELLSYMDNQPEYYDILLFETRTPCKECKYTKRDVFIALDYDTSSCANSIQRAATYCAWRNTEKSRKILNEWLKYCQDEQLITDNLNIRNQPNYPQFKDHRHDQSILSILSKKYNIPALPFQIVKNFIVKRTILNRKGK